MKSHRLPHLLLKSKLAGLPILLLAACQSPTVYHSYQPIPSNGWAKSDTLVYALPPTVPADTYDVEIELRYREDYPYRDLWLAISHNTQDTLTYVTDTLQVFLTDETGNRMGNSPGGLYQHSTPYKTSFPIRVTGNTRTFRIVHIMTHNPLPGMNDVGLRLQKSEE